MKRTQIDSRTLAKRAAVNALRRAKRAVSRGGIDLSVWEGEFLDSIETRLNTYGRAFADPDKGAAGQALSVLQGVKLKEIKAKAEGRKLGGKARFGGGGKSTGDG